MKVKIYRKEDVEPEKEVLVNLDEHDEGVTLVITNKKGDSCCSILTLGNSGKVVIHSGIGAKLGLDLDGDRCVLVEHD